MALRPHIAAAALLLLAGCGCEKTKEAAPPPAVAAALPETRNQKPETAPAECQHTTTHVPQVSPLAVCEAKDEQPLDAARSFYDQGRYEQALSCAAQAAANDPDDPQAHSERGAALSALARFEEAQVAYARALALDPDHLDGLLGAAHLYGVSLPSTRERDELAVLYSERGLDLSEADEDHDLVAQFALLSSMAFNDLGQARDALDRAEMVLALDGGDGEAAYERAVALFELCRFAEAKDAFARLLADADRKAHAHHHLGLLLEREGRWKDAEGELEKARKLSPEDFPAPQLLSQEAFAAEVKKAVDGLPPDMRKDLEGVPVSAEEIPRDEDLLSGEPPLSPAILGLFRGPPIGQPCLPEAGTAPGAACRSVALYRRNLARAVKSRDELIEQIRVTLLHEVGHLRGEDDFELAARGLE